MLHLSFLYTTHCLGSSRPFQSPPVLSGICRCVSHAHSMFSCYVIYTFFSNISVLSLFSHGYDLRISQAKALAVDSSAAPLLACPAHATSCRAVATSPNVFTNTQQGQCCQGWQTFLLPADVTLCQQGCRAEPGFFVSLLPRGLRQKSR